MISPPSSLCDGALRIIGSGALLAALCSTSPAAAASPEQVAQSTVIGGPRVPVAPEVVTRDAAGNITVRAIGLSEPLRVDGRLDEAVYQAERAIEGFVQLEPVAVNSGIVGPSVA